MPIQKARELLDDEFASSKSLQECIDSLRRESQYITYAIKMRYRTKKAGEKALAEIEKLSQQLKGRL